MNNLQSLSSFYDNKKFFLQKSLEQFVENTKYFPQIGIELEFYLLDQNSQPLQNKGIISDYITALENLFAQDSTIYKIEKEQGDSQIEIKIAPHSDLLLLAEKIEIIKEEAKNLAQKNNFIASFSAQPFNDDCGSALQFNFSLHNKDGHNLFIKNLEQNNLLLNTIAGMLDSIEWAMIFYAPQSQDYLRFDLEINRALHKKGKFTAPVNISFGDDNRTAAVRVLPIKNWQDSSDNFSTKKPKETYYRIEFRVAAADADSYLAMASLLASIESAIIKNHLPKDSSKIFGNAFDDQYSPNGFAKNLQSAQENFAKNPISSF